MGFGWRKLLGIEKQSLGVQQPSLDRSEATARQYGPGELIGGEYRVLETFAGGMGRVYRVSHPAEDDEFVLKTLQRPEGESERAQFRREAEVWLGLGRHRNIVRARFVSVLDGQEFVAADYVPGSTDSPNSLQAYVNCRNLPVNLLLMWTTQFCHGMLHARSRGLVAHRDIKPANLMLMPDGELRVTDFGLARSVELPSGAGEGARERSISAGTPPYMAPEQILTPDRLDHRVDIYAFGVTLYELIAGTLPFRAAEAGALFHQTLNVPPRPLSNALWPLVERCLQKSAASRFRSFEELLAATKMVADRNQIQLLKAPPSVSDQEELTYARAMSYGSLGRPDLALQYASEYARHVPDDDRAWTELGKQYLAQNRLLESLDASQSAVKLAPFKSYPRNNMGVALSRLGRYEEAITQLTIAASNDPLNVGALLNQASPLMHLGRSIEAQGVLQRAVRIAPSKASAWVNLGAVQMEIGLEEAAAESFRKALKLHPGLEEANRNLRLLEDQRRSAMAKSEVDPAHLIAAGRFREAERLLLERVESHTNDRNAWHNLGLIAMHENRSKDAISRFERVIALHPAEPFARNQLIRLKCANGDLEGALGDCKELALIPTERVRAVLARAQILQSMGKSGLAVSELKNLIQGNPELDQVWFVLSEIYERDGQYRESLDAATKALTILQRHGGLKDNVQMIGDRIARLRQAMG